MKRFDKISAANFWVLNNIISSKLYVSMYEWWIQEMVSKFKKSFKFPRIFKFRFEMFSSFQDVFIPVVPPGSGGRGCLQLLVSERQYYDLWT